MPSVPKIFSAKTDKEIEEWGYLGLSENIVFDMMGLSFASRKIIRNTDRWSINYRKGLARREMEFARKLSETNDSSLIKEALKSTSLTDKKIVDDNAEFEIDAPSWMKPKVKTGKKGKREIKD